MMTNDDGDGGVHESVASSMRAAAMIAMQVGERLARAWTELARDAERRASGEAAQLAARIEAERALAVASLTAVERPDWWEHATVADVAGMVESAATWADHDPAAARAMATIDREVQDRYGRTAEALHQRTRAGDERTEAIEVVTAADAVDRAAARDQTPAVVEEEHRAQGGEASTRRADEQVHAVTNSSAATVARGAEDVAYDTAERREQLAGALADSAEPDQVAGRVRADVNFAHPAEQATAVRGNGSVARGRPGPVPDRSRHRPPRSR